MPHLIIDCSKGILETEKPEVILREVSRAAYSTNLFVEGDIKVRLRSFDTYIAGHGQENFIHVFSHILEGRTSEQKRKLSDTLVGTLKNMFPHASFISSNVQEFDKATYSNKNLI